METIGSLIKSGQIRVMGGGMGSVKFFCFSWQVRGIYMSLNEYQIGTQKIDHLEPGPDQAVINSTNNNDWHSAVKSLCYSCEESERVQGKGSSVRQSYEPGKQNKSQNIVVPSFWEHIKSTYTGGTKFSLPARAFCSKREKKKHVDKQYTHTHTHTLLKNWCKLTFI